MEPYMIPVILILAGGYFLIRNIMHINNDDKLRHYVETSPKAKMWVKKFGKEKTMHLSKKYFLPAGMLVSLGLITAGVFNIVRLM